MFKLGERIIDPSSRDVRFGDATVRLSPKAFGVLQALIDADGGVMSRADLLDTVWAGVTVGEEVLTHAIGELRRALGDKAREARIIQTVHKTGYRLRVLPEPDIAPGPPAGPDAEPPSTAPGETGERKRVTVLATDLGDAGRLLLQQDAELAEEMFRDVAGILGDVAETFGGKAIRTVNDCCVFLFGAPQALENHALLACAASAHMRDALRAQGTAQGADHVSGLRVGISSGDVVVRNGGEGARILNVVGAAVSRCSEVMTQAMPGTICLDASTFAQVRGALQAEPAGSVRPNTFVMHAFIGDERQLGRPARSALADLAGRDFEMSLLRHGAGLAKSGLCQVIAISGEAGIGKSRLYREFLDRGLDEDWHRLAVGACRTTCAPLQGIIDLMHALLGLGGSTSDADALARIGARFDGRDELVWPVASLLYLATGDNPREAAEPRARLRRTEEAVAAVLAAEAARSPVAVVFEDLHWASDETVEFLGNMLPMLRHHRVLLLLNWRPEFVPSHPGLAAVTHHRMGALTPEASAKVLRQLLGPSHDMDRVERLLIDSGRGNPLFMEECVLALAESGAITGRTGRFRLAKSDLNLTVPETVHEILAERIDHLDLPDKSFLQVCSVIGNEAPIDEICALAKISETDALAGLRRLIEADLVHEAFDGRSRVFVFKHAMTHEVAYFGLLRDRRVSLHRDLAGYLEAKLGRHQPDSAAVLAHHWTAADAIEQAIPYWLMAGLDAVARCANAKALSHLETALALLPRLSSPDDREKTELRLRAALGVPIAAVKGVGSDEAMANFERSLDLARRLGDEGEVANARFGIWLHKIARLDINLARTLAGDMMQASPPGSPARLQALHAALVSHFLSGDLSGAMDFIEAAIEFSDNHAARLDLGIQGGHDAVTCALGHKALILWLQGRDALAEECSRQAMNAARTLRHPATLGHALMDALKLQICRRAPEDASDLALELAELADEHSLSNYMALARAFRGWCMACSGDPEGLDLLGASFDTLRASGRLSLDARLASEFALLSASFGRYVSAKDTFESAVEMSLAGGSVFWLAEYERVKGKLAYLQGNPDLSEACYRKAIEVAEAQGASMLALRSEMSLSRLLLNTGRTEDALAILGARARRTPFLCDCDDFRQMRALLT